jgi:hypothetical protein
MQSNTMAEDHELYLASCCSNTLLCESVAFPENKLLEVLNLASWRSSVGDPIGR